MLAKMTSKNQITLPKAVIDQVSPTEYFDVEAVGDHIVLRPVRVHSADAVREKLQALGISESDVGDAIVWAKRG